MKKITLFILAILTVFAAQATDLTGVKIYINPGHGGYNGNDRSIWTIPVPETWTNPDGYWESKSNLVKGLALKEMLESAGATVIISRTDNTSGIRDGAQYAGGGDRDLSEIAEEANANNVDHFLSIHSNALNTTTNYLLLLYHGYNSSPTVPASLPMAQSSGPVQIDNPLTVWTSANPILRGDFDFYGDQLGLGVLRPLTVPGFLSEGSFHDYPPETHRLCSNDYCKLEAMRFFKHFNNYFQADMPQTGTIAGFVKSGNESVDILNQPKFTYKSGSDDQWLPLNGATVKLLSSDGATELASATTDDWYNGIFAFYNLAAGNYKLSFTLSDYETKTVDVTVTPGEITYAKTFLKNINIVVPDYPEPDQGDGATALNSYDFVADGASANPSWLSNASIKRVLYRNDKLYVLTTDPKILIIDATTMNSIGEMDMTGIEGGSPVVSDIAFTADGYLLACNKETISIDSSTGDPVDPNAKFKVYMWNDDTAVPGLLFETQKQGNWLSGVVGETFAVSGSYLNLSVYYSAVTTAANKRVRIVGLNYRYENQSVTVKYMGGNTDAIYEGSEWGEKLVFTISPSGSDHLLIDSELLPPTEYQFDWAAADRFPLVKKGTLNQAEIPAAATGGFFFRYAKHTFVVVPVCNSDLSQVGMSMFDVTEGLDNAVKISDKYPSEGLGATPATYMMAGAKVNGYDIEAFVLAKEQGVARFKTESNPVADIYASELSVTPEKTFKFTLNENASSAFINIYKEGESLEAHNLGALQKGVQTVQNPFGSTEFDAWSVTVTARPVAFPAKVSGSDAQMTFYNLRGVAVDNTPQSPYFGRVYASEAGGGAAAGRTTQDGIYVLDAALQDVTSQDATAYTGNVSWSTTSSASPFRVKVSPAGNVYVTDWSDSSTAGVWVMDPANPAGAFNSVFGGTLNSKGVASEGGVDIHGSVSDCHVLGTGDDTKLYTFDEDLVTSGKTADGTYIAGGNLFRYDIGTASAPWAVAPSAVAYDDVDNGNLQKNGNSQIAPDARGGWWISQYRAAGDASTPSLIHVSESGSVDYNSATNITDSYQGGMAVTADGSILASGGNGVVRILAVSYGENNAPSLELLYTINHGGGYTYSLSFDAAGNLYIAVPKSLLVYSLPKAENTYTTHVSLDTHTAVVPVELSDNELSVYPNPVRSELNIRVNRGGLLLKGYTMYDLKGMTVSSDKTDAAQAVIQTGDLAPGVYVLQVVTSEGLFNKRIIKQ